MDDCVELIYLFSWLGYKKKNTMVTASVTAWWRWHNMLGKTEMQEYARKRTTYGRNMIHLYTYGSTHISINTTRGAT